MIHLNQAIIVEGKYDKIKLSSVINAVIITTNGFSVMKNRETLNLIRFFAEKSGIIILTDSDSAGFKIRNYIKGALKNGKITNVYIPDIIGKEKRKSTPSKEGKLGVEGMDAQVILEAFKKAGIFSENIDEDRILVTKTDLYEVGLSGGINSSEKRQAFLKKLDMPQRLTSTGMLEIINAMMSRDEFFKIAGEVSAEFSA